ncbi:unnamed protein product [Ilex paraguariensis]|uniref:Uncharacterized protein n=1 Tax=Ilex paraguariensis TaxID=185542 RepID=A0ABC8TPA2_9AQUA
MSGSDSVNLMGSISLCTGAVAAKARENHLKTLCALKNGQGIAKDVVYSQKVGNEIEIINPLDPACSLSTSDIAKSKIIEGECCEDDESDEDYISILRPAFLVDGEPDFDSGPPEDGLEYLRRVR